MMVAIISSIKFAYKNSSAASMLAPKKEDAPRAWVGWPWERALAPPHALPPAPPPTIFN